MVFAESEQFLQFEEGRAKTKEMRPLHLIGCMLYWAEGSKTGKKVVFVNSDPNMLLLFRRFLREELKVKDEYIRIHVQCHAIDPQEIKRIEAYWINLLHLPESCLRKTTIKKGNSEAIRHKNYENGFCVIGVYRVKLLRHILGAIQEYSGLDNEKWEARK